MAATLGELAITMHSFVPIQVSWRIRLGSERPGPPFRTEYIPDTVAAFYHGPPKKANGLN